VPGQADLWLVIRPSSTTVERGGVVLGHKEHAGIVLGQGQGIERGIDRPHVPPYRWLDDGPRLIDLRVKYAAMRQLTRRRLADLLASGTEEQLARAQTLYILLAHEDPLDHRLWEALARLHGRPNDLHGLEATLRRLRGALLELGEGEDHERVAVPPALAHVLGEVRASLLGGHGT
jgi:hypothetical protein